MRLEILKNFATPEEITALNTWVLEGVNAGWLGAGSAADGTRIQTRLTTRFYADKFEYSPEVLAVANRVRQVTGISEYPIIDGHGKNGVVVSYTLPGGSVDKHKDPKASDGSATLRCNIITQVPENGGVLYIDNQEVPLEVGDLHCYLVSEHEHYVTTVGGSTPRILWMFGAHVPADDWNSGKIKVANGLS